MAPSGNWKEEVAEKPEGLAAWMSGGRMAGKRMERYAGVLAGRAGQRFPAGRKRRRELQAWLAGTTGQWLAEQASRQSPVLRGGGFPLGGQLKESEG